MSIWSSLVSVAAPIIGGLVAGPAGFQVGQQVGAAFAPKPRAAAAPTITAASFTTAAGIPDISLNGGAPALPVRVSPQGAEIGRAFGATIPAGAGGVCPTGFHLDKRTRSRCVRNRRMNPLNGRAASRAIRRIKGARKMLQKIERGLPRAKARATPRHGHRVHVHTDQ